MLSTDDRDFWIADQEIERDACPDCGGDQTVCADPDVVWYPYRKVCQATMSTMAAARRFALLHEKQPYHDGFFASWAEKASLSHPFHFDDGVRIGVALFDIDPDDDFIEIGQPSEEELPEP